jgi:hypothetical protein
MAITPATYYRSVFINCPFDWEYLPLYQAIIFVIIECGFIPRCASEAEDSGDIRIQKITEIIAECCFGVHDISRTERSFFTRRDGTAEALPRFNMPLELGLFIGAQRFGSPLQRKKNYLVFDVERDRYRKFISDLAGQDIKVHAWPGSGALAAERERAINTLIIAVRNWLNTKAGGVLTGGQVMGNRFHQFKTLLPTMATAYGENESVLSFYDLSALINAWIRQNPG